jgi:tetratricopeptide (TPR) repeat protein
MKRYVFVLVLLTLGGLWGQTEDRGVSWQEQIQNYVRTQQLDAALQTAESRLQDAPADLEAHGWRGRLLAWKGRWHEAETEYRTVLQTQPHETEILCGLADVLLWQQRPQEALESLDHARRVSPADIEILLRRGRVLQELGRQREADSQFREVLDLHPENQNARDALSAMAEQTRHQIRIGQDVDTFNFTDAAQAQSLTFASRWNSRWSTVLGSSFYQRFGQTAEKVTASTALRFGSRQWLGIGGAAAHDNGVIPKNEAFFEYGHGFRFQNEYVQAVEASYQQKWLWYQGPHILTLTVSQLYYFPKEWTWTLSLTGARSGFSGGGIDWVPSGSTRIGFPLYRRLSGNLAFAAGSEDFAQVDQVGRFAARTFSGGLRYRFARNQDISGYIASQDRSKSRTQNSFGLSYGFHF